MATEVWKKENKDKLRKYRRTWYKKNAEVAKDRVTARRKLLKKWFKELKSELRCVNCGENDPACIEFHHKDPSVKESTLNKAIHNGWSVQHVKEELRKCDPMCANCHRKLHFSGFWHY